jgi:hypothetical protein
VPGPFDFIRLAALAAFLALVAVGLWLLDVAWWVIPPVMIVALLVAWTIEWFAWRQGRPPSLAVSLPEQPGPAPPPVAPEPAPPPPHAFQPPVPMDTAPAAEAPAPPEPEPRPVAEAAPPEPEPEPEPKAEAPPEPVAAPPPEPPFEPEQPPKPVRRSRRVRLRPVPAPRREPGPEPAPTPSPAVESSVVAFVPRTFEPRQWNLWDLERIAREQRTSYPERREEWSYLFLNLRQFADADGSLPAEFDGLVRESFAGLLEPSTRP